MKKITGAQALETVNEVLAGVLRKSSNEQKLLRAMTRLPDKYDFGDRSIRLSVEVATRVGMVVISRTRDHYSSEPFAFTLEVGERRYYLEPSEDGSWRFSEALTPDEIEVEDDDD